MKKSRRKIDRPSSSEKVIGTVVISFRAPVELVRKLDEIAENDYRNRANFVLTTLARATSEELVKSGEFWLKAFHQSYAKDPVGSETEFWRGQIAGWKRTLVAAYGGSMAENIILRASEAANLPVPHSGTLSPDGRGYEGFDSFSHAVL
jgi:predicted transcriptional regulator